MKQTIGERQRWVWMLSGLSVVAVSEVCSYSWTWVLLGSLGTVIAYLCLDRLIPAKGIAQTMASVGWIGKGMILLTLLWNIIAMGWAASLADQAFPMVDGFPTLGWVLLGITAWANWKGSEVCARCCGVLALFLLFLYGIVVVFALPDLQLQNLKPVGNWNDCVWVAGLLFTGAGAWYMPCDRNTKKPCWMMVWVLPIGAAVVSVITAGVLSPSLMRVAAVPFYTVAQSVSVFGVIERIESLLSAAMTMGVFSLLTTMAASCQCLGNCMKPNPYYGTICCVLAFGTIYFGKSLSVEFRTFCAVFIWLVLPLLAIVAGRICSPNK